MENVRNVDQKAKEMREIARSVNREDVLEQAGLCVTGDRNEKYGEPEDNFATIAEFWTAYLGRPVDAEDVAAMMILLKVARAANTNDLDSWIDIAGYAACGGEIAANRAGYVVQELTTEYVRTGEIGEPWYEKSVHIMKLEDDEEDE